MLPAEDITIRAKFTTACRTFEERTLLTSLPPFVLLPYARAMARGVRGIKAGIAARQKVEETFEFTRSLRDNHGFILSVSDCENARSAYMAVERSEAQALLALRQIRRQGGDRLILRLRAKNISTEAINHARAMTAQIYGKREGMKTAAAELLQNAMNTAPTATMTERIIAQSHLQYLLGYRYQGKSALPG